MSKGDSRRGGMNGGESGKGNRKDGATPPPIVPARFRSKLAREARGRRPAEKAASASQAISAAPVPARMRGKKRKPLAETQVPSPQKTRPEETRPEKPGPEARPAPAMPMAAPARQTSPRVETSKPAAPAKEASAIPGSASYKPPLPIDLKRLAGARIGVMAGSAKAGAAVLKAMESGERASLAPDKSADIAKTLGAVAQYWLSDPTRLVDAQKNLSIDMIELWQSMLKRAAGDKDATTHAAPAKDARFADPEWTENPYFNFLKQLYFLGAHAASELVEKAEGLDEHTRRKAAFYVRQLASALSPTNFVLTNPELLRTTIEEHGENLARGMKMLAEDIEAGKGELKIRQTDAAQFEVGVNLATTPGKVVFRNELIELIQYAPTTETVFKRPLLIVPPWINKFYILDLNPEKSFIRWAVGQGLTVFVVSWVQPDATLRGYDFEAYMKRGILAALDAVEEATGEAATDTIGYCVGGTLLAVTLAYLAQDARADRVASATLFTTQVDFTHAGELLAFVDEAQIKAVEEIMAKLGYLPGEKMASAFNMLRPNDLIWSYMVNNYLKGKQPAPFDLLYWNSDSTRMAEANHSYYLRNCYLHNRLAKGEMVIGGRTLDLRQVTIPIYNLAAKEDHIAPAKSVFVGSKLFGGPVTYVMAGSGHIAGVVNPVTRPKYQFWTGGPVEGVFEDWVTRATETSGTWWPHWLDWLTKGQQRMPARMPGGGRLKPLGDAPGTYVKMKA